MFILPAESSKGAPYWGDGHGGAYGSGIGVPDDEVAYGLSQHPPQRTIGGDGAGVDTKALTRTTTQTHPLGQLADDVGEESRAAVLHAHDACPTTRQGGTVGVDASGSTLVHLNAGGRTSVHVCVSPGGEVCVAVEFATQGTPGGGPTEPLLQSSDLVGPPATRAPQSPQDGVAGGHWPLTVIDNYLTGDGEIPYLGGGALAVTDVFSARDGETPNLAMGALVPFVRDGGGANARSQHGIDIPTPLLAANRAEEESTDATTGTTDRARKLLEKLLLTLLPACVIALGPLSGAPDYAKLANYIIMGVLIVLLVIGMTSRACARHVVRLATCAGIFAMTVFVSTQLSRRIYIVIAALVGMALSGITLAV